MKRGKEKVLPPGAHLAVANWLVEYVGVFGVDVQEPVSPRSSATGATSGSAPAPSAASAAASASATPAVVTSVVTALQLADPKQKIAGDLLHRYPAFDHPTQEFPVRSFALLALLCVAVFLMPVLTEFDCLADGCKYSPASICLCFHTASNLLAIAALRLSLIHLCSLWQPANRYLLLPPSHCLLLF
jgi:hypothetical protein